MSLAVREKIAEWASILEFFKDHLKNGVNQWEIDLRPLSFINSVGLGALVTMNTSCRVQKGKFQVMVEPNSQIARVLKLSRLQLIMQIVESASSSSKPVFPRGFIVEPDKAVSCAA